MAMDIKVKNVGKTPVFIVNGRIVQGDSEKFGKKLSKFIKNENQEVALDLSHVEFVDSFGLGILVKHYTELQQSGRKMVILNSNPNRHSFLWRLFNVTGLDRIFKIVETLEEV